MTGESNCALPWTNSAGSVPEGELTWSKAVGTVVPIPRPSFVILIFSVSLGLNIISPGWVALLIVVVSKVISASVWSIRPKLEKAEFCLIFISPITSNSLVGAVIPIPTLPSSAIDNLSVKEPPFSRVKNLMSPDACPLEFLPETILAVLKVSSVEAVNTNATFEVLVASFCNLSTVVSFPESVFLKCAPSVTVMRLNVGQSAVPNPNSVLTSGVLDVIWKPGILGVWLNVKLPVLANCALVELLILKLMGWPDAALIAVIPVDSCFKAYVPEFVPCTLLWVNEA